MVARLMSWDEAGADHVTMATGLSALTAALYLASSWMIWVTAVSACDRRAGICESRRVRGGQLEGAVARARRSLLWCAR